MKANKKKPIPILKLRKKLDEQFSLYVRLIQANSDGMVTCFTSGAYLHYKKAQAGHFISRRHLSLRYDLRNVKVQSIAENRFNQGNGAQFAYNLQVWYGYEIIGELLNIKKKKLEITREEYISLIAKYKADNIKLLNRIK